MNLKSGAASVYFITDAKRGIAALSNPYVIISKQTLSIELLADIYTKTFNSIIQKSILRPFIRKAQRHEIIQYLEALVNDQKPPRSVLGPSSQVFIISKGIEKSCLNAMKILKIRGILELPAVNVVSEKVGDELSRLGSELNKQLLYQDVSAAVYRPKQLSVVANRDKAIISIEKSVKEIIKLRHELSIGAPSQTARDSQAFLGVNPILS